MTLQSVHLRVTDAGKQTPVRLRITDAQGTYHAPLGRRAHFPENADLGGNTRIAGQAWAYIDGACEIRLPPGELRVRIEKGLEYRPIDATTPLAPGKLSMRFEIERLADLRSEGWYAGDIACHELAPHAALLEGAGEDLAVVNLLVQTPTLANIVAFSGQNAILEQPGTLVAVNSRNRSPLGNLLLLNCHRPVYPLAFELGTDVWTLADWCQQCHRVRMNPGLVIADNYFSCSAPEELTAQILLGGIDALRYEPGASLELWFTLLNAGRDVPLVAGSGKDANVGTLGGWRTYAQVPEPWSYRGWIEAIRAGRTWITSGPLLTLRSEGKRVVAEMRGGDGELQIVGNEGMLASRVGLGVLEIEVASSWVCAQVLDHDGRVAAITSALRLDDRVQDVARQRILSRLDRNDEAMQSGNRKQRQQYLATSAAARERLGTV